MQKKTTDAPKELVTIAEYARVSGLTESAIRSRIYDGHWMQGVHFHRKGRRIMIDPSAVARWWANQ